MYLPPEEDEFSVSTGVCSIGFKKAQQFFQGRATIEVVKPRYIC